MAVPSSTVPIITRGPRPEADVWKQNRAWSGGIVVGAVMIAMGVLLGGVFLAFALQGGGGGDPTLLAFVLFVTLGFPSALGAISLVQALRTPRAVGSTLEAMLFQYWRLTKTVPYRDMTEFRAARALLTRNARLLVGLSNGSTLTIRGLPSFTAEGAVSQAERRAPQVLAAALWSSCELRGGQRLPDYRLVEGLDGTVSIFATRKDAWVTPTEALASTADSKRAAVLLTLPLLIAFNLLIVARFVNLDPLILLGVVGVALGIIGIAPLYLRFKDPSGTFGTSSLEVSPRGLTFEASKAAIAEAIAAAGLHVTSTKQRTLFGIQTARWSTSANQQVALRTTDEAAGCSLTLSTRGRDNAALHRRLKGELLLSFGYLGATTPALAGAPRAAPSRGAWNNALLSDGRTVPDGAFSLVPDPTDAAAMNWSSRSAKADKRANLFAVPMIGFLIWFLCVFMTLGFRIPFLVANIAGIVLGAGVALLVFAYQLPAMRGHAGMAVLNVIGAYTTDPAVSPVVERAAARLGLRVAVNKGSALWHLWKIDGGVKVRFTESTQGLPARLYVNGRGETALVPYAKLKGAILEELGAVPPAAAPPPPPLHTAAVAGQPVPAFPAAPAAAAPPTPAAVAPPLRLPLPRGLPLPALVGAPEWAFAAVPGLPVAVPDGAMPLGGVEALPVGRWVASPFDRRGGRQERAGQRIAIGVIGVIFAAIVVGALAGGGTLVSGAISISVFAFIFGFAMLSTTRSWRKQRKERYQKHAQSYMAIDPAGAPADALAWAVGAAMASAVPTAGRAPPPPGAIATWRENTGAITVTLWTPPGRLPYVEVTGPGGWPAGARAKGAIEFALYGNAAQAPPAAP